MIALLCPTKRPEPFQRMVASVLETAHARAVVFAYVDAEDWPVYANLALAMPVEFRVGPRIGPTASLNLLIQDARGRGYDAFGVITDDASMIVPDWDLWLEQTIDSFPGRLGVVSARHYAGTWCNFPFISREMLDLLGWYAYPGSYHYVYDTVLELIGEATAIRHATSDQLLVNHECLPAWNLDRYRTDAEAFTRWCVLERPETVKKLQAAAALVLSRSPTRSTG